MCFADDKPQKIYFNYLTSPDKDENSALSGSCSGTTQSYEIDCKFWQLRVRLDLKPEELPKEINKAKKRMKEETKDFDKLVDELCRDINRNVDEIRKKMKNGNRFGQHDINQMKAMIDLCSNPTYEKFEEFMIETIVERTKTCKVSADLEGWTAKFKRVAKNKWVSTAGPEGLCNVVTFMTLEHEPNHPNLWTYTRTRSYAEQENQFCKHLEVGKELKYDWRDKTINLDCKFIEYGF